MLISYDLDNNDTLWVAKVLPLYKIGASGQQKSTICAFVVYRTDTSNRCG